MKRLSVVLFAVFALTLAGFAKDAKKPAAKKAAGGGPEVAYLQKICDAWGTMNTANVAGFYNQEPDHAFFDISPLKYNDWKEYDAGVQALFKDLKSLKLTVNDDVKVHGEGDWAWITATLKEDATTKAGKREMATIRWTAVFEKTGDKWLIVHEHVSAPQQ
jgi:ketosteroid isomerase-like protein